MYQINQLTSDPLQTMTLILPNGNPCNLTIYFIERQVGWFITNLTYGTFQLNGVRICNSPNMLYQWKNLLQFGLACYSSQNREPSQLQDFSSGSSILYILNQSETEQVTEFYQND